LAEIPSETGENHFDAVYKFLASPPSCRAIHAKSQLKLFLLVNIFFQDEAVVVVVVNG
jgi:hypothetical protein